MAMAYAAASFSFFLVVLNALSNGLAALRAKTRSSPLPAPSAVPGVSIVRPLCGVDNFCEEALESSFNLNYPSYELIFCVAEAGDPVLSPIRRLIARYPGRDARLIIGDEKVCFNPKLNNCVRGWDVARHDWIILADSNVLMPKDYIQRLLLSWRRRTGLVCSMPLGSRAQNLWAGLGKRQAKNLLYAPELFADFGQWSELELGHAR